MVFDEMCLIHGENEVGAAESRFTRCGAGCVRSKTVVIAKLEYGRPAAADAEYLPAKPVLRSDIPGSATGDDEVLKSG
jgi:hypothetical protein